MIRTDAQLSVSRFAELIDVSRRTYTYRLTKHRRGDSAKGRWPAPVVDRIEPVVAKYALACPITATSAAPDLIAVFEAAIATAETLLGVPLIEDCIDPVTGELCPVVIVTDNGPAMKSIAVAKWFKNRPEVTHVRTRHRSPHTNGVIERWFQSLKHERLYRHDIATVIDLADHVNDFIDEHNTIHPNETLDWQRPLDAYLKDPTLKPAPPKTEQES